MFLHNFQLSEMKETYISPIFSILKVVYKSVSDPTDVVHTALCFWIKAVLNSGIILMLH